MSSPTDPWSPILRPSISLGHLKARPPHPNSSEPAVSLHASASASSQDTIIATCLKCSRPWLPSRPSPTPLASRGIFLEKPPGYAGLIHQENPHHLIHVISKFRLNTAFTAPPSCPNVFPCLFLSLTSPHIVAPEIWYNSPNSHWEIIVHFKPSCVMYWANKHCKHDHLI